MSRSNAARSRASNLRVIEGKRQAHERLSELSHVLYTGKGIDSEHEPVSLRARILYHLICENSWGGGGMWWGWRKMCLRLDFSKTQLFECLTSLKNASLIAVERRGRRTIYIPTCGDPRQVRFSGPIEPDRSGFPECDVRKTGMNDLSDLITESVKESAADGGFPDELDAEEYSCYRCKDTGQEILGTRRICACFAGKRLGGAR